MRKILFLILGIVLTFVACSKDDDKGENTNEPYGEITVDGKKYSLKQPIAYNEVTYYSIEKCLTMGMVFNYLDLPTTMDIDLDTLKIGYSFAIGDKVGDSFISYFNMNLYELPDDENFVGEAISGQIKVLENNLKEHRLKFQFINIVFEQTFNGVRRKTLTDGYAVIPYERIDD